MIKELTDETFELELSNSSLPILVEFGAEWCGPCKKQLPVLDKLALENNVNVVKVDIDNSPNLVAKYKIRSVPTLILIKDGQVLDQKVGMQTLTTLQIMIKEKLDL